jgi:hypothetical protein
VVGPSPGSGEAVAPPRSSLSSEVEVDSEPRVGRGGDHRLRPRLSPSPGLGEAEFVVFRSQGRVQALGSGKAEFVIFRSRGRVRALGRARRSPSSSGAEAESEPWVGRGGVRRLPEPRLSPSPGVGQGGASYGARCQTWLLSASLCRAAQQSERRRRRCPLVRPVSGAAKRLRSLRLCRLRGARQDKVSGHPRIKCFCDTVGRRGDLAKVASW